MITIYFGLPRSGKSTLICRMLKKNIDLRNKLYKKALKKKNPKKWFMSHCKYDSFYANMDNKLCPNVDPAELGVKWVYPDRSLVLIDEAGIQYNSRKTLSLPQSTIAYLKLHGHYKSDLCYFSQTWEDIDVTLRRLAERYYYIKKVGPFTMIRRIKKVIMINEEKQIIDGFEFFHWWLRILPYPFKVKDAIQFVFRPPYYKYFDSYSKMNVPQRDFKSDQQNSNARGARTGSPDIAKAVQ